MNFLHDPQRRKGRQGPAQEHRPAAGQYIAVLLAETADAWKVRKKKVEKCRGLRWGVQISDYDASEFGHGNCTITMSNAHAGSPRTLSFRNNASALWTPLEHSIQHF
jgi:hypothetical protein